jgi:hypothetical protein
MLILIDLLSFASLGSLIIPGLLDFFFNALGNLFGIIGGP